MAAQPGIAHGRLSFERCGRVTAVRSAYAEPPLRLLTPRNHGAAAWAYTSTLGGGLVDGDRLRLEVALGPGAQAFISTQGPTRVYRSPRGCESALHASVGEGALLILAPDPAACFAGARFRQRTEIDLGASASVASWDVLSAGRSARGERWAFARCHSSLTLRRQGRTVLDEAWLLDPRHGALAARLGRFEALATLLLTGPLLAGAAARIRAAIEADPLAPGGRILLSASPVGDDALVVRLAAVSVEELVRELRTRLAAVPALLGDDPWARRC
jgi:urease accessory protein